ncbi:hypothetical protein [Pseudonocardia humida]|uniref:Uncharacterized protein n=1 Tax=Pseudonocardia humida TaxID=2800819 RepID=A0ABT1A6E7_9PSEU|nr:hypothetical protein [Pseudonocardia humida]MCO1658583.1 hypothetical protein [Pseudonocardia humida]
MLNPRLAEPGNAAAAGLDPVADYALTPQGWRQLLDRADATPVAHSC